MTNKADSVFGRNLMVVFLLSKIGDGQGLEVPSGLLTVSNQSVIPFQHRTSSVCMSFVRLGHYNG